METPKTLRKPLFWHLTYVLYVPPNYWRLRHPHWDELSDKHRRGILDEEYRQWQAELELPGTRVRLLVATSNLPEVRVQLVPVPWLYRLWWWVNGRRVTAWHEEQRQRAIDKYLADTRALVTRLVLVLCPLLGAGCHERVPVRRTEVINGKREVMVRGTTVFMFAYSNGRSEQVSYGLYCAFEVGDTVCLEDPGEWFSGAIHAGPCEAEKEKL